MGNLEIVLLFLIGCQNISALFLPDGIGGAKMQVAQIASASAAHGQSAAKAAGCIVIVIVSPSDKSAHGIWLVSLPLQKVSGPLIEGEGGGRGRCSLAGERGFGLDIQGIDK